MLRPFLALSALLWSAWSLPDFASVLAAGLGVMPLAFFWAGCPCCSCACFNCTTGQTNSVQVDISGVTNFSCTDCADVNGSWILAVQSTGSYLPACCWYDYDAGGTPCGFTNFRFGWGTLTAFFVANDYVTHPFDTAQFSAAHAAPAACASKTLSYISSGYSECDWTAASVSVTSV